MGGLERYRDQGILPGNFLQAILSNDLKMSCSHADDENLANLSAYVGYMYNEMPSGSHGSREIVDSWHRRGGLDDILLRRNQDEKLPIKRVY